MKNERPLAGGEEARVSIGPDARTLSQYRPRLQANPVMQARLTWLLRIAPYFAEARHG